MSDGATIPREAASLVLFRDGATGPDVLMGRRRDDARFMPGAFVFPGGGVDPIDRTLEASPSWSGTRFHAAALRECWEETGVALAAPGAIPPDEDPFLDQLRHDALSPAGGALTYIARAVTPEGLPIRFDTRFFLADDALAKGTAQAIGELPEVRWISAAVALADDRLRGVTKFVLAHACDLWAAPAVLADPARDVPCYTWIDGVRTITQESQTDGLT